MGKNDSKTATELINLIRDIVTDELNKRDNTCVCQVIACNKDDTYNIAVIPDTKNVVTNVKSMSLEVIKVGDYVYVYKFQNKLNNAIILARAGTNAADIRFVTVENFDSTITTRSSGGEGGKVDDVLVNNTSVVGEDKVARIDLTSYVLESELADVAFSGDYADLLNTPLSSISISQNVLPGTASRPETTTTTITIDGVPVEIKSYTKIDNALSSSSKNPVANDVIYNAISNKVDAEDFQELEQIALTTRGVLTGEPLTPVLSITDGAYYPTVSDSGQRWKMGKADSPTFFKIYDVSNYTSVHLKSVSRAGHILTDTVPSDFNTKVHQNPTQVSTWYEAASVSDSEQADVLPKTGYTPYDKDLTTNGKHYLIVYEVNAAQAIEVIYGGGYSPITTSMFVNDGDGTSPYARLSDLPPVVSGTNDGTNWTTITIGNATYNIPTGGDGDHYPTGFSWTNGTTAGPTGSLTGNSGFSAVSFPAIPAATALQSGVVTTGNQNFKGVKNFPDGIKTSLLRLYDGYNDDYSDIQSGDCTLEITPSGGDTTYVLTDYGRIEINNSNGTIRLNFLPSSGTNATINMPSSSGTLALTSDIQNVELVDLTGVN